MAYDKLLLADSEGKHIPFQAASTTKDSHPWWQPNAWRYIYLHDAQTHFTVAVSQRWEERYESMYDNIWLQFILLLIALPIILGLIWHSIYRGLQPLNLLAKQLQQRQGNHLTPISENVPAETLPLVQSFNRLLERASIAMQRERRFSADAAHELRSPLAALKIQTEVLAMSETAEEREHHIQQIINSLERASHLTDQLLILSRLDPMDTLPETEPLNWDNLARQSLSLVNPSAREKHIRLKYEAHSGSLKLPNLVAPYSSNSCSAICWITPSNTALNIPPLRCKSMKPPSALPMKARASPSNTWRISATDSIVQRDKHKMVAV